MGSLPPQHKKEEEVPVKINWKAVEEGGSVFPSDCWEGSHSYNTAVGEHQMLRKSVLDHGRHRSWAYFFWYHLLWTPMPSSCSGFHMCSLFIITIPLFSSYFKGEPSFWGNRDERGLVTKTQICVPNSLTAQNSKCQLKKIGALEVPQIHLSHWARLRDFRGLETDKF